MTPDAQRLKHVRSVAANDRDLDKLSQAKFAKMLGVNPSTISHIEAGTTRIQIELANIIEEKTGFCRAWLVTGDGPQKIGDRPYPNTKGQNADTFIGGQKRQFCFTYVKKVKPLLSAGSGELVYEEDAEDIYSFRYDWLDRKGPIPFMRLAQISGDSMHPTLKDGDFVLFDISRCDPLDGKIMVVGIDNLLYIKRVRVSPDGIFLVSDNREVYEPWRVTVDTAKFLGLVIWHCGDV